MDDALGVPCAPLRAVLPAWVVGSGCTLTGRSPAPRLFPPDGLSGFALPPWTLAPDATSVPISVENLGGATPANP